MHVLLYDFNNQKTYHSAYRNWSETLLCEKKILLEAAYTDIEREDDAPIIHILSYKNVLFHLTEAPHLYIYIGYAIEGTDQKLFNSYCLEGDIRDDINQTAQEIIHLEDYLNN